MPQSDAGSRCKFARRNTKSAAPRTLHAAREAVAAAPPLVSRHPQPQRATPWRRRAAPRLPRKPMRRRGSRCRALAPSRAGAAVASCPRGMGIGEICTYKSHASVRKRGVWGLERVPAAVDARRFSLERPCGEMRWRVGFRKIFVCRGNSWELRSFWLPGLGPDF